MGPFQSDKHLGFADLMSIGILSIAVLLLLPITETASPIVVIIVIVIVCGIGLAIGTLLAEAMVHQSHREGKSTTNCRGTRT